MEPTAHEIVNPLLWLIPAFPLIGYLLIAFLGAGVTRSPKPVIGADPHGHGHAHGEDAQGKTEVTAALGADDAEEAHHVDKGTHAPENLAHHDTGHGHDDHGHHEAQTSPAGTKLIGGLATLMVLLSFVLSVMVFFQVAAGGGHAGEGVGATLDVARIFSPSFTWMTVPAMAGLPDLDISFRLAVDPLTALMLLVVTGIGTLIHLYSTGYMAQENGYARYFGYLNLFIFFMLLLIMGSNFLVMFVGWEGVGLASYLLIGYYYEKRSAGDASKKAFIVNRVGDFAFLIALFLIYKYFGTFEMFGENGVLTRAKAGDWPLEYLGTGLAAVSFLVPLLMFIGATGKSAQIPLYVWLPDAMEGPTPVSALIHAATMVTAGVFMVCRSHALFMASPEAMKIVAIVGLMTALLAATIGLVQNDIKKVLAYSTVSQLGYMFLGAGVGAFSMAMFHVTTHAFFKALLFLGSGSVIHAMHHEQDMRKMGDLYRKIRTTYLTMFIGTLAIAGIPFFAGFFSKDEILLNAFAGPEFNGLGSPALWFVGWVIAGMTPFYMWRMMGKTFKGEARYSPEFAKTIHESPPSMTFPLIVLAALSVVGGFLNPAALAAFGVHGDFLHTLDHFLGSTTNWREQANLPLTVGEKAHQTELLLVLASIAMAVVASLLAASIYYRRASGNLLPEARKQGMPVWRFLYNKWGVDDLYIDVFVKGGKRLSNWLWRFFDVRVIDGTVNGIAGGVAGLANSLKGWQSGYVRNYALSMLVGVIVVVVGCLIAALRAFAR